MTICKPTPKLTAAQEAFFWSRVDRSRPDGCWSWLGAMKPNGYGIFQKVRVHRIAYSLLRGSVPDDMSIDHLCRNRRCVNPAHLEVVTMRENTLRGQGVTAREARQTHCKRGHEFTPENAIPVKNGRPHVVGRACRQCKRERDRREATR
jgi:hypothetical protein